MAERLIAGAKRNAEVTMAGGKLMPHAIECDATECVDVRRNRDRRDGNRVRHRLGLSFLISAGLPVPSFRSWMASTDNGGKHFGDAAGPADFDPVDFRG